MGKEREKMNQSWKEGWIWKCKRKVKEWIKDRKENKYKSRKGIGKNESKLERRMNMKVEKERDIINQRWKQG